MASTTLSPLQIKQRKRLQRYVNFIDSCDTNFTKVKSTDESCTWSDTITVKLDVEHNTDYNKKFGVNFMDERTFLFSDENNNSLMVYRDLEKVIPTSITPSIHVLNFLCLTSSCFVHKQMDPIQVPEHIKVNLNFVQNNIQQNAETITNNMHNLQLSHTNKFVLETYCDSFFIKGEIMSIKQLTQHPMYTKSFRDKIITRNMHICKCCNKKYLKGCCENYSLKKRSTRLMVLGWKQ